MIRYGRFTVDGSKYRNLINRGALVAIPTFTCSGPVKVTFGDNVFNLVKGKNYNMSLALEPGDNYMYFECSGSVDVVASYREASL